MTETMKGSIKRLIALAALLAVAATGLVSAACGGDNTSKAASTAASGSTLPQGSEKVKLNPADFTTDITNRYFPMKPGSRWVYRETDTTGKNEKVVVEVTNKTKTIANGVKARVIRDTAYDKGKPVEVTDDWYAQDKAGNIWYLGENTKEFTNGKVSSTAGSFEAGVKGAQAGIALPGNPTPGLNYRQEYDKGNAEDRGGVITVGKEQVQVPAGFYDKGVLMTRDLVPLEPKVQELKFYAPGVGPTLAVHLDGTGGRAELVSYTPGK